MSSVPPRPPKKLSWFGPCAVGVALWGVAFSTLVGFGQREPAERRAPVDPVFGPPIAVSRATPAVTTVKPRNLVDQTREDAHVKSAGCIECHAGIEDMHASPNIILGCTDCHGGTATSGLTMTKAHVAPRHPELWQSSANPSDSTVLLNHESPEFIRFVNPRRSPRRRAVLRPLPRQDHQQCRP